MDRTGIVLRLRDGTHGRAGGASCTGDLEASARHSRSSETGESFAAGELARGIGTRAGAVARHRPTPVAIVTSAGHGSKTKIPPARVRHLKPAKVSRRLVQLCFDFYMIELRKIDAVYAAGSLSASSPGSSGSAESSSAGSTIPRISWALFNSPAPLSSSGDFEIGSSNGWLGATRQKATR